jgi:hypothetical protein
MSTRAIFGRQVLLTFVVHSLVAKWYVRPRLTSLPLHAARPPLLVLLVGLLDLINAFYQGLTHDVQLGAAYFIPAFVVPALVITHLMMFRMLVRHPR